MRVDRPLDVEPLAQLWVAAPPPKGKKPPKGGESQPPPPPRTSSGLEQLWVVFHLLANEVKYRELRLTDCRATATLKDNRVTVTDTGMKVNGGTVTVTAVADLKTLDDMEYHGTLRGEQLPLDPLLASFAGVMQSLPVEMKGDMKRVDAKFDGHGLGGEALLRNLNADADVELGRMAITRIKGRLPPGGLASEEDVAKALFGLVRPPQGQHTTFTDVIGTALQLVLYKAGFTEDKLAFQRGQGKLTTKGGNFSIDGLRLIAEHLELLTTGVIRLGGQWDTDIKVEPLVDTQAAGRLKGAKLQPLDDGRFGAPPIAYRGVPADSTGYLPFLLQVTASYYGKSAKYLKYLSQGGDATKDLKTLFGGEGDKGEAVKDLGKGLFELGKGILEERSKEPPPPEPPADTPKKKKKKAEPAEPPPVP